MSAPVSKQNFSACAHAAYYFLIVWYASSYRIAYVKGNTDISSAKNTRLLFLANTAKVNSSNHGLNSAFALRQADHITAGILPLTRASLQLTLTLCRIVLSSSSKPDRKYFSNCRSESKYNLMYLIAKTPYENVRADHRGVQVAFSFHSSESKRVCRTLIYTRCFKVRWKNWCGHLCPSGKLPNGYQLAVL